MNDHTTPSPVTASQIQALTGLGRKLQEGAGDLWTDVDNAMQVLFGHKLFTALVFDRSRGRLARIYSNNQEVSTVGGAKAVTDSPWSRRVLMDGQIYVGSTRDDIRTAFSEYEQLWGIGCESVLNIPVQHEGETVATLNLLDAAGRYDAADRDLAWTVAQMLVAPVLAARAAFPFDSIEGELEHV